MSYCQTYNKSIATGHGTLIGNWLEEEVLRDASGHTHLDSSPHLDTFKRVMGDRSYPASETFITSAGRRDHPQARQLHEQLARTPHAPTCRRIEELTAHVRESCMFRAKALDAEALEIALKERNVHRVSVQAATCVEQFQDALEQTTVEECAKETESSGSSSESTKLMTPEDKANRYFEQMLNARPQENTEFVSRWTELASAPRLHTIDAHQGFYNSAAGTLQGQRVSSACRRSAEKQGRLLPGFNASMDFGLLAVITAPWEG
ncbi:uncharacterized protein LOC34620233 [Cyclospora cayetanensis]|uniref:Uncharacterized protein LOC34620233 n=1 Tax=Cyclospora cayetanensis TaxID=88456 RepID=A0A6P6RYE7_9EIME|nr:uncharacterized protein LOC34620233 [Cyclospora cayetanensis]